MITTDSNALHSHQPGLCILMATVLPPHMAASTFPIAASRTGPRRIRALYLFVAEKNIKTNEVRLLQRKAYYQVEKYARFNLCECLTT